MLCDLSDLLQDVLDKGLQEIASAGPVTHGPAIGSMHEGLTSDIIGMTIPPELDLHVVTGFIRNADGTYGRQLDCIVVNGEPDYLPRTDKAPIAVCKPENVIAVIEVKKRLNSEELEDSFEKMRSVTQQYLDFLDTRLDSVFDVGPSRMAFAKSFAFDPETLKEDDVNGIGAYNYMIGEQLLPLRIVLAYEGYANEYTLRKGVSDYMTKLIGHPDHTVRTAPSLIICGLNSIIKINGHPYTIGRHKSDYWDLLASCGARPLRHLVTLIWHKLEVMFPIVMPDDTSPYVERLNPMIRARMFGTPTDVTTELGRVEIKLKDLKSRGALPWRPIPVTQDEYVYLMVMKNNTMTNPSSSEYLAWCKSKGIDPAEFISGLVNKRLIVEKGDRFSPLYDRMILSMTPRGGLYISAEPERAMQWVAAQTEDTSSV